ncbi:MAG: hypothetical protein KJ950_06375 [Proteobacteria bacterium]|nr:hypothetical protein [Pseudomonadota bacterium]MBU1687158.1 hypothetical protein [Pseudomonadota bacterium]
MKEIELVISEQATHDLTDIWPYIANNSPRQLTPSSTSYWSNAGCFVHLLRLAGYGMSCCLESEAFR